MKGIQFFHLLILIFSVGAVGCSSALKLPDPMDSGRKGFFDRMGDAASNQPPRKTWIGNLEQSTQLGRRARLDVPRVDDPFDLKWPLQSIEITSPYGKRGREFHEGVDLRAKIGTSVYAAQSGVVLYADSKIRGYGKMVVVRHDGKVATIYAHNSKILVKRGQQVKRGQKIAISGNTGRSHGPHLHFEVRRGLYAVNPLEVLPKLARRRSSKPALLASSR